MFNAEGWDPSVKTTRTMAAAITKSPEQSRRAMISFLFACMLKAHPEKKTWVELLFERNFKPP
jgi:hypothetical protein